MKKILNIKNIERNKSVKILKILKNNRCDKSKVYSFLQD